MSGMRVCAIGLIIVACVVALGVRMGEAQAVPVEGARFQVNASIGDNLKTFQGKRVFIVLDSGKELGGIVKEVGGPFLHLEQIEGMDFFDALIRLDQIDAVKARFRAPK
jgi:hypothetical protein